LPCGFGASSFRVAVLRSLGTVASLAGWLHIAERVIAAAVYLNNVVHGGGFAYVADSALG
jgi:hypothetical protein